MKKIAILVVMFLIVAIIGFYYIIKHSQLYDMGTRGHNVSFFHAEYEKGKDKCYFDADSTQVTMYAGTFEQGNIITSTKFSIYEDTILVDGKIGNLMPYVNTNKLFITESKLFFHLDSTNNYDTSYAAKVFWFNRTTNYQSK